MSIQDKIIKELGVRKNQDDIDEIIKERVEFLKDYLVNSKCTSYVLGISGGVDSLTAGLLAQQAINELNDDGYACKFIAVKLPYAFQADAKFVEMALSTIKPNVIEYCNILDVTTAVERGCDDVLTKHDDSSRDFIRGNIKARSRMVVQYAIANAENGLVIGTDHSAEAVSGFFTKHGDGACDIIPLAGLVKGTVRKIAKQYGASPELYEKVATADLEDLKVNLPDEEALGLSYDNIDAFLMGKVVPKDVEDKIVSRYFQTQHKRSLPICYEDTLKTVKDMVQYRLNDIPNDFRLLLDTIEDYARTNKLKVVDVLHSVDTVADILSDMENDGTYSTEADNLWYWYYDIATTYENVGFEITKNKIGDLDFGKPISKSSETFIQQINKIQDLISMAYNADGVHDVTIKRPTLKHS